MRETRRARGEGLLMDTLKPSIHGYDIFDGPSSLTLVEYRLRLEYFSHHRRAPLTAPRLRFTAVIIHDRLKISPGLALDSSRLLQPAERCQRLCL